MEIFASSLTWLKDNMQWIFSGIGVALLMWLMQKLSTYRKTKLKVRVSETVSFIQVGDNFGPNIPLLAATITNVGNKAAFARQPLIWISRKLDGTNTFQSLRVDDHLRYPIELAPGQEFRVQFQTIPLDRQLLSRLKESDSIKVQVEDTLGNKFLSRKLTVKRIREFNRIGNTE